MEKVKIAFDVDGTLRCNCTDTCRDPNPDMVELVKILGRMKNTELFIWSGGGADYANQFRRLYELEKYVKPSHCLAKIGARIVPDIAIDDIQSFKMGKINLIVREK